MSLSTAHCGIADTSHRAHSALSALVNDCGGLTEHDGDQTLISKYNHELGRLRIWENEHGVREGNLDHALREAQPLRERVLSLLEDLSHIKNTELDISAVDSARHTSVPDDTSNHQIRGLLDLRNEPDSLNIDDKSIGGDSSGIDTNISLDESVPESLSSQIHDLITNLFELGPSLLDPAPHDRLQLVPYIDAARYDLDHARARFPLADQELIYRLGLANWERRQFLTKRRSQHEENLRDDRLQKLRPTINRSYSPRSAESIYDDSSVSEGFQPSIEPNSTRKSTVPSTSEFNFSDRAAQSTLGTDISVGEPYVKSPEVRTERTYGVSGPPMLNQNFDGQSFACPYCFRWMSDIATPLQWRKHVFEDLEPYMCTFKDCICAAKTYGDKDIWWEHELEKHSTLKSWKCAPCQHEHDNRDFKFDTSKSFDDHIRQHHPVLCTPARIRTIREMCQQFTRIPMVRTICPLCQEDLQAKDNESLEKNDRLFRNHIADHLEQLAFFVALPAGAIDTPDYELGFIDDSDSEGDRRAEVESIATDDRYTSKKDLRNANLNRFIADQENTEAEVIRRKSSATKIKDHGSHGGKSDTPSSSTEFGTLQPVFPVKILMHPPNELFYGRESLLLDAATNLNSPGTMCIFHGVGGIGKTLAAVEYIYRYQNSFDAIFWLQADTDPGLFDSYLQMAIALGLIQGVEDHLNLMDRGRDWLQGTDERWLLIFDNVLTWEVISPCMPNLLTQTNGSVLITTQHGDLVKSSENVTKLHLEPLDQESGSEMLLRYLSRDVVADPEKPCAREISTFVGGLPVAIAHVAGYADFSRYSLEDIIETFREWRRRTGAATDEADDLPVSFREASFSYDETLAMVWNVTLRELSRDSQDVMYILAYLNCEAVPQNMLWGIHEDPSLHFLDSREKLRLRRIKDSLIKRRLVQFKEVDGEMCFSVHRSLQRGIRETLSSDGDKQQLVFDQAILLIREVFPRSNPLQQPTPEQRSGYQKLLPHLHSLVDIYRKFGPRIKGVVDFAQLLSDAVVHQFESGITKEGILLLETAEEVLDTVPPTENQAMRADIHAMIALMYDNTGIGTRQRALDRRTIALQIRKEIVNASRVPARTDEILLYNSWMEYAISLLHYHRFEEAEPIVEQCLVKYREWGNEMEIPFEYAKYYHKMASVRMYQGKFSEAIDMASRSVQLMNRTGYVLFETRFRFDLACIVLQSGDIDQALKLHREIFDSRLDMLGQTNELTLHSRYAIGAIYEIKGQYEEAEAWFRKALDQRRGITSWPEEAFARAQFHLARVLVIQERPEDVKSAETLREKALKTLHRLLPLDYPSELQGVTDEAILFDHMLTNFGTRFLGHGLLLCLMKQ